MRDEPVWYPGTGCACMSLQGGGGGGTLSVQHKQTRTSIYTMLEPVTLNEPLWPRAWTQLQGQSRDLSTRVPFGALLGPDGDAEAIIEP